jgi:hypothetical protein
LNLSVILLTNKRIFDNIIANKAKEKMMTNLIIPATDKRVIKDVEYIRSTLKDKYGFKADIDDLPLITQNPAPGRTRYLVFVASKITLQQIIDVEKISYFLKLNKVLDFSKYQFMLPPRNALGYWLWMSAGELYAGKAPSDAEKFLGPNERGGMMYEGLYLFSQYGSRDSLVDLNSGKPFMDFIGSRHANGGIPCLDRGHDGLRLDALHPGYVHSHYGSVSVGAPLVP